MAVSGNKVYITGQSMGNGTSFDYFTVVYSQNITGVIQQNSEIPDRFCLSQNYPNPFNPSTFIKFDIPKNSLVTLKLYDIVGREAATLIENEMAAGSYKFEFNGTNIASGVYFYKLSAGNFSNVKKMVLLK